MQGVIVASDSEEESPTIRRPAAAAMKEKEEEYKEPTREELSLCISPYQRYDHDFGTHHVRLRKLEQWKRADEFAKKDLIPKSSRTPLDLKTLLSGATLQQKSPKASMATNIGDMNLDIASMQKESESPPQAETAELRDSPGRTFERTQYSHE